MKKIIIFGAGNIGRSLLGYLFSRAGYEVVFIDVDDRIVEALNAKGKYRIEIRDVHSETIWVENIRGVHAKETEKVASEILTAELIATAVGVDNLPRIYENIARGLIERFKHNEKPIDIIICENMMTAAKIFREGLSRFLPKDFPLDSTTGFVETCIGKMVPIMTGERRKEDPLLVFGEAYSKIIADRKGFKGNIPVVNGLLLKDNIAAYVEQKLFIHNMGHSLTAYLGYITDPEMRYIWEAISNPQIYEAVKRAMWESGKALILEHPDEFNFENMGEYIDDLIRRFNNRALGDTIYRVGRDLPRKLSRNERFIGALLLDAKHSVPSPVTAMGVAAAILFRGKDEEGKLYYKDQLFVDETYPRGIDFILRKICGLEEEFIAENIKKTYESIVKDLKNWFSLIC